MKTLSSVHIILTFIENITTSSNQRNSKKFFTTDATTQNIEDAYTIDGVEYLSCGEVFLLKTKQNEAEKVEKHEEETSHTEFSQTQNNPFQLNETKNSIDGRYNLKENNEFSYVDKVLRLEIPINQSKIDNFDCSYISLPAFHVAFPEKAYKEHISEPFDCEYIERDAINPQCIADNSCYQPIINETSTVCSEQANVLSQKTLSLTESVEIQTNNSLPFNIYTEKNIKNKKSISIRKEILMYKKIKNIISNVSIISYFINRKIFEEILKKVNHESAIIIKEELCNLMFTSNFYEQNNRGSYSDIDLLKENILLDLKNRNSKFYCNKFETNDDLKTILTFGRNLVKFENVFLSNLNLFEWLGRIEEFFCDNLLEKVKETKINLIVPELNYFFEEFGKNNIDKILEGHILYVHYIYVIIKLLTRSIFENNESVLKNKSTEERKKEKILMDRRIFFMRILMSELFRSFKYDSKKIEIYRFLNLIYYFSNLATKKAVYFGTYLFNMKIRFIFRFIFDSNIKIDDEFKNDLVIGILCQLLNRSASKLIQRRLFALIYNHFCLGICIDNVLGFINVYRNKFDDRVNNILFSEAQKIKNLHKKIYLLNISENIQTHEIEMIKIFLELEFRISSSEKRILGNYIHFMHSFKNKGYENVFNRMLKEVETYYQLSK